MRSGQIIPKMVTVVSASHSLNPLHVTWLPIGSEISSLMSFFGIHFMWSLLNLTSIPLTLKSRL